jgi:outer membrane protein assembly factor BamB
MLLATCRSALIAALLGAIAVGMCLKASGGEDWPRWRGPRGDGTWNAPAVPEKWPESGPPVVWQAPIGPGYSGISVSHGRVYTMDRLKDSQEERVVCLDEKTGQPIWEHRYTADYKGLDYDKGPRCTPTVYDGHVYTLGAVGHVFCLDAASGKLLWSKDIIKDGKSKLTEWGFGSSIVIDGPRAIVHAGVQPGGCYIAYDRATGQELWRGGDDTHGYGTPIVIEHAGMRQLVGWTPKHIVALDIASGKLLWEYPYDVTYGVSIATPIFHDDTVLVCGYWHGSKAIKLGSKPTDAELLWEENRYTRGLMDQPLYKDGYVYLLERQHGTVAFELAKGEMLWTDENKLHPRDRNPQVSMVWLNHTNPKRRRGSQEAAERGSGRAICLNAQGELILVRLSPDGLVEDSRAKIIGETWAHPGYAGNCCFARDDEKIICVRIAEPSTNEKSGR